MGNYTSEQLDNAWKEAAKTDDYVAWLEREYQRAIQVAEEKLENLRYRAWQILDTEK